MSSTLLRVKAGAYIGRARLRSWLQTHAPAVLLGSLITAFVVIAVWDWITAVIPAGHVGVEWYRFAGGTDTETVHGEGNRFMFPWDKMAIYDARLQQFDRDFDVLTRDGLMMSINVAVRYRLNQEAVGQLHKNVGPAYVDTMLVPTVGSLARIVFSQNSTDAIYTDRRIAVQAEIMKAMVSEFDRYVGEPAGRHVPLLYLDDVLIRSMRFPPALQSAVNRKMEEYQLRQEYTYRLQREQLESERKEIEARGIANFQQIVGAGISDTYLRWKGIDATLALAQSPNAKIVVIGTGKDGMPLILGGLEAPQAPASSPASGSSTTEHSGAATNRAEEPPTVSFSTEHKPAAQNDPRTQAERARTPRATPVQNGERK
jgi:regulator of protease activity HflC (stomatin/prohibitin superfamily)